MTDQNRRGFVRASGAAAALATLGFAGRAGAQGVPPLETVRIVTGFPPGGTSDTLCRRVAEGLVSRGGRFVTLVHPTAIIAPSATLGAGSIVCPFGIISDAALTGACVLVNYHASLAHGSSAADFAVLSPYSTLAGNARIGVDAFLGLHASVGPGRHLGDRTKVSANSSALTDSPPDSIVFGVPGRIAPLLD